MNERIDHTNYEAWLLDRSEGNLTPEQVRELDAFLLQHPGLDGSEWPLPSLTNIGPALSAAEREALKRTIPPVGEVSRTSVEDHLVARLENDLSQEQLEALSMYLKVHPELHRMERIYALTKVIPEAIVYNEALGLYRRTQPVIIGSVSDLDELLVARLEGDLLPEQELVLAAHIASNEALQRSWALMQATRTPAVVVPFPAKDGLKKKEGRVVPFSFGARTVQFAAAAAVALLLGLGLWLFREAPVNDQGLARVPAPKEAVEPTRVRKDSPAQEGRPLMVKTDTGAVNTQVPTRTQPRPASAPTPMPSPVVPEQEEHMEAPELAQAPHTPDPAEGEVAAETTPKPVQVNAPVHGQLAQTAQASSKARQTDANGSTLRVLIANTVRERVLDAPSRKGQEFDGEDAIAMVDKSLKAVAGERTGLAVARGDQGGVRAIQLRLGRNFSISASR